MTEPAVWFLTIRAGTGADVFTRRLHSELRARGVRTEVTWLPHRAEYLPWTVPVPEPPAWANILHVNTWLDRRFVPTDLPLLVTMHHSVHDHALKRYKSSAQALYHRYWVRRMEAWILSRASRVVAVSRYTALKTYEEFGADNVAIIHNGVNIRSYPEVRRREPGYPFRLLYVGSWSKRKGVDLLGPIMEALGEGFELWFTDARGSRRSRRSLPPNCVSIGRPSDEQLIDVYTKSHALLLPTRLEGFGQVAIEAMACGTPVIATDGSALPEVVENGVTGYLCPQDDVSAFVGAARRMAEDHRDWRRMSLAGQAYVKHKFDASSMVDKYTSMYRSLL